MRSDNLPRLSVANITKSNVYYLHYKSFHRDLFSCIEKYGRGKLVDIGCGNKPYEKLFGKNIIEYIGCDIIQSDQKKVDVLCAANNIPLPDADFDTAFSTQTIEHVEDHQGLVSEAYRLLKPDGHFILSGPMYWHLHEEPYDFFRFTKYGYQYILQKAGFEVIEILPNGGIWATCGQAYIHALMKSQSKKLIFRCWRSLFFRLKLYWIVNSIFSWLDDADYNPVNTMNYVVVAKKKSY